MATISTSTSLTLADLANRQGPDGSIDPKIIQILNQSSEILDDALFQECNDGSSHKTTVMSGLPTGTWRLLNYDVQPEKTTSVQIRDTCGMLETYSKVDAKLVSMAKDKAAFRKMLLRLINLYLGSLYSIENYCTSFLIHALIFLLL